MKNFIQLFLLTAFCAVISLAEAQITITLKPGPEEGKDAQLRFQYKDTPSPDQPDFKAIRWTCSGAECGSRGIIEFDLSAIPEGSIITSAYLSLFHNPTSSDPGHSKLSGSNACWLRRIITPWEEDEVTWNTQPLTTTENQVFIHESKYEDQNYLGIDVTNLLQDMVNSPQNSYGFMLILQTEMYYRSLLFASSDHEDPRLWPELEVTYTPDPSVHCLTIKPGSEEGKDAQLRYQYKDTPSPDQPDFKALRWTCNGSECGSRGIIDFDFSQIPESATIISAFLSLYHNPTSSDPGHSKLSGSNACWLRRVTSPWEEEQATWNSQPSTTTLHQVELPESMYEDQDYLNIDVTKLVQDMHAHPDSSFGFMLLLQTEQFYRSMIFASSDHSDSTLHPEITVCYRLLTSQQELEAASFDFTLYPNPANHHLTIKLDTEMPCSGEIRNISGVVVKQLTKFQNRKEVDISSLNSGVYFVRILGKGFVRTKKLFIQ